MTEETVIIRDISWRKFSELVRITRVTDKCAFYVHMDGGCETRTNLANIMVRNATPELLRKLRLAEDEYDRHRQEIVTQMRNRFDSHCRDIAAAHGTSISENKRLS